MLRIHRYRSSHRTMDQAPSECESRLEMELRETLETRISGVCSSALWPGPFSFMYESEFLPFPYDNSVATCECVTKWEHDYFACKLVR